MSLDRIHKSSPILIDIQQLINRRFYLGMKNHFNVVFHDAQILRQVYNSKLIPFSLIIYII
jgi:hypothetical protein